MDVSGRPYEGWMTMIPLSFFVLFVVAIMGGPDALLNDMKLWAGDLMNLVIGWLNSF